MEKRMDLNAIITAAVMGIEAQALEKHRGILPDKHNGSKDDSIKLVDGQARAAALGLIQVAGPEPLIKCPIKGDFVTYDVIADRLRNQPDDKKHAYDQMCVQTCDRFKHCREEIIAFFELEKSREVPNITDGSAVGHGGRSREWAYFWQSVKELDTARANNIVRLKRMEKLEKKGHKIGPKPLTMQSKKKKRDQWSHNLRSNK